MQFCGWVNTKCGQQKATQVRTVCQHKSEIMWPTFRSWPANLQFWHAFLCFHMATNYRSESKNKDWSCVACQWYTQFQVIMTDFFYLGLQECSLHYGYQNGMHKLSRTKVKNRKEWATSLLPHVDKTDMSGTTNDKWAAVCTVYEQLWARCHGLHL